MAIIKRMVIKGFKSFASKTEVVFGDSFNCIMGPNGAGKTNVSDAICFALGRSNARDMRAERSAALIYHGGKKNNPSQQAEVMIEFDNSKKEFPIEGDIVQVKRVVNKKGLSRYTINEEVRTRQQVVDFLNIVQMDPDGYNIVLQGDIVGMAEMKPVEKRKLVEQILGISSYEEKKEKCLHEIEKVDAKLNETNIILKERDRNLRELKKDRDLAKRYKELEGSIKDEKGTLLHLQIGKKKEDIGEVEKKKKTFEDNINRYNKELEELKEKIDLYKQEVKDINSKLDSEGEKNQFVIKKEIDDLKEGLVRGSSRIDVCNSEVNKASIRKEGLKQTIKELEDKINQLEEDKKKQVLEVVELEKKEKEIEKRVSEFRKKHNLGSISTDELKKIEEDIDNIEAEINRLREDQQVLIRARDQLEFKINSFNENIDKLQGKGKSDELKNLKQLKDSLNKVSEEEKISNHECSTLLTRVNETRQEIYAKESELSRLRAKQLSIKESSVGDLATRKILEQMKSINGIHGTVAQLGTVDSKYALALEVAAGAKTYSVVVDTDITAKKCIEYLKQHKLGVVRFLPMNKINAKIYNVKTSQKGVYGLAINLVKFNKKYDNIFAYVFGSTLIVEDIDTARAIGIGKARMVTVDGDLMEFSGAIVGGHRVKDISRGFRERHVDEDVEKLMAEIVKLKRLITDLETAKMKEDVELQSLREHKSDLSGDIVRLEKTLNIDGQVLEDLIKQKETFEGALSKSLEDNDKIEKEIAAKIKNLELLKPRRHEVQEKLTNVSLMKDVENIEMDKLELREQRLKIESSIKGIDMQITSMLIPEKEKTLKIIKQHEGEVEDFKREIVELKEVIKKRNSDLKAKQVEESKFHADFKNLISKRDKVNDRIRKVEEDVIRKEEGVRGVEHRMNDLSILRAKELATLEGLNEEFKQYEGCTIKRGMSIDQLKGKIASDEREFSKLGNVNLRALEVYEEIEREYLSVVEKLEKLNSEKEDVLNMVEEIEQQKKKIFMKNFRVINDNFRRVFSSLTSKGEEAYLELENPERPFEGGLDIRVKIGGRKFVQLRSLSGGEKTLAALAFIFSLQEFHPSPFYLLDEVDASLDKANSELLLNLVKKYSGSAQYIVISHNDALMTGADYVYGITMQDGVSKIMSMDVKE